MTQLVYIFDHKIRSVTIELLSVTVYTFDVKSVMDKNPLVGVGHQTYFCVYILNKQSIMIKFISNLILISCICKVKGIILYQYLL